MIEKGVGFKHSLRDFGRDINVNNVSTGIAAGIFGLSAGVVMISAGVAAGLGTDVIMAWVTSMYLLCGIFSIIVPTYYRVPIPMATSIPGALLFAAAIPAVGLGPTMGATLIAGIISLIVGRTGYMGKIIRFIPMPIVMGMIGGILLKFGLNLVTPLQDAFLPALLMIGTFIIVTRLIPKFPAVLASLLVGIIYVIVSGVDFSSITFSVDYPTFVLPQFTLDGFLAYGLPLAVILIGMETPAGAGLLQSSGFKNVPVNGITAANGIGTMVASFFCLHSVCIAAPMTGITGSPESGKIEGRWVSAVTIGIIFLVSAPFYGSLVKLFEITPGYLVAIVAGLALVRVLISTIGGALAAPTFKIGALFSFLIAASGITILGIGSSFWALVFGFIISLVVEAKDFQFKKQAVSVKQVNESVETNSI
ncbi:benzoate/H(+) symporter BenE family transporter [Niallia sp. Krafla_26]|uniref:benzoate/H(+) symporter BenE family transporter n=1 Tax=Niallia sp. Krafla_26 TaxID=3064703 RepID=UPI003D174BDB